MKFIVWTDFDLDGAASALIFKWAHPNDQIEIKTTTNRKFRSDFQTWAYHANFNDYDKVVILDIDCSNSDDLVDSPKVWIIDHHENHANNIHKYIHAIAQVKTNTSCAKMLYEVLWAKGVNFNKEQKALISIVDDYDSYTLKFKQSLQLNNIFWSYSGNKVEVFMKDFANGFKGFTAEQAAMIYIHDKKYKSIIKNLDIYAALIPRNDRKYKFVSAFCDFAINEVARHIIETTDADVGIIINPQYNTVNIRKKPGCDYPIASFARILCEGDGSDIAAGGVLTEKFAQFSKTFKKI